MWMFNKKTVLVFLVDSPLFHPSGVICQQTLPTQEIIPTRLVYKNLGYLGFLVKSIVNL
jgi:hypothetical protein